MAFVLGSGCIFPSLRTSKPERHKMPDSEIFLQRRHISSLTVPYQQYNMGYSHAVWLVLSTNRLKLSYSPTLDKFILFIFVAHSKNETGTDILPS